MKQLHVLNGDSTAQSFAEANLPGDVVTWREALSEGPVLAASGSFDDLWAVRRRWLEGEDTAGTYDRKVVREFEKLSRFTDYDEVCLWFEHDLFCQINLVFLLAWFSGRDLGKTVLKQVSVDAFPGVPFFKGMGELNGAQLGSLYLQAEPLTRAELDLARRVWNAYAGSDPMAIQALGAEEFGRLRFLEDALILHLQRFPFTENGLNLIEQQLAAILMEGPKSERVLIGRFLRQDRVYGMGDLSVEQYIREGDGRLWDHSELEVRLTENGTDLMTGRRTHAPVERWLGGYFQTADSPYRWDSEEDRLVQLTN
ncbi:DUF1835 domain-containing protein [Larkinella soli]|uniref:DUF1835 domain-containing protein n=1 Tax=Larkinella soli TaxID=1770527 RepID=UPI000FFCAD2D|nr:DUF1835 domain-containing protein [Larkinella soli]